MEPPSLESRLVKVLALIGVIAVGGVLMILPYRLYERDIRHARVEAHRISSLLHVAVGNALERGEDTTALLNRFQSIADFEMRLRRLAADEVHPAETTRKASSQVDGTDLTYVAPPLVDRDGNTWLAESHFDLSRMKRDSVQIIIDLVIAIVAGSLVFSVGIYFLVRNSLLVPLRTVTSHLATLETAPEAQIQLPAFQTREMQDLGQTIERVCHARQEAR
jgi:hypothetical protein